MKTKHIIGVVIGVLIACGAVVGATEVYAHTRGDHVTVNYSQVPAPVKSFLGKYFGGARIKDVKADYEENNMVDYDIRFTNGIKVEIDQTGRWEEISGRNIDLPLGMLPQPTLAYISANYPNSKVVKMEQSYKGYEVEFSNGLELKFDAQGNFMKIDK